MRERQRPVTQTIKSSEVRQNWSQVLNQIARRKTRVMVEKSGIPVAVLISADDFERLSRLEAEREARFSLIDRAREAFKDVPDEELEREIPKAVEAARAEALAERERAANTP